MDTKSQIAEKIREIQENNLRRAEAADEADRKMAEGGYESKPVVEQVIKEDRPKKKKVSVQRKGPSPVTADIEYAKPGGDIQENPGKAQAETGRPGETSLNESLTKFEEMLGEGGRERSSRRETITAPEITEPAPEKKIPSKLRGPHRTGKVRTRYVDLSGRELTEFCLIDPVTGEINPIIRDSTTIGRSPAADITVNNRFVSEIHVRITREGGEYSIEDIGTNGAGSTNGTKINGRKIAPLEKEKIEIGDTITLAATNLIFDVLK